MDHRHATWLVSLLLLSVAARLHWAGAPEPHPPVPPCHHWVQIGPPDAPLICLDTHPEQRLRQAGVPPACLRPADLARLTPGDRLVVHAEAHPPRCERRRMPAPLIQTLRLTVPVNQADAAELATLPGIGPRLAARIVASRRREGPFRRPEELRRVRGIGPRLVARIRSRIRF
jgi:competence ComEA-like helix-hairpin-helix protein